MSNIFFKRTHSTTCEFPVGCSCGTTEWNNMVDQLNATRRKLEDMRAESDTWETEAEVLTRQVKELRKATYELFYRLEEYSVFKLDQPPVTDLLSAADKAAGLCGWKAAITATEQSAAGEGKGAT